MLELIKKSPLKMGIILGVLVLLNVVGWVYYFRTFDPMDKPIAGERLELVTPTPELVEDEPDSGTAEPEDSPTETVPAETPEMVVEDDLPAPVCGDDNTKTILLTGIDSKGYLFGLADSIRVVRIDYQRKRVDVLAFPRDLWVDIPGISQYGVTEGKLNQAYFYGTEGMGFYDGPGYGSGLLANTLLANYGVSVDHYVSVNLHAFRQIVDALGGIDVYLPEDVYIKFNEQPKLYLNAGSHHLDGKQAEQVVRARIEINDFGRIRNQTVVLKALAVKMLTPNGIKQIPDFATRLISYVMTDFSVSDITQMACIAAMIDPREDIHFANVIPVEEEAEIGQWVMDEYQGYQVYALFYDKELLEQKLADFQSGTWLIED